MALFPKQMKIARKVYSSSTKRTSETIDENSPNKAENEIEPRRSKQARVEKSFGLNFLTFMLEVEPQTYNDAIRSSKSSSWKYAIKMDLLLEIKPLNCKWIFKRKIKADRTIDKYIARLLIDKMKALTTIDTLSPVSRITSIRMILAIVTL
ncbi:Retrovirus-related Pol polyprotein from transposon TNT 1-94 [Gossypium australe]|uniref:Retrovirus-related Pol polyprotein from transposon TNT 1-94 n=1 Tax=Gossypium australe TaxID=47621 RepID=A0A5B6WJ81_9ROSI|nr:Retrovirus-related Pol polyprotein from transposon TNT 1-94 [Gossypium australe]